MTPIDPHINIDARRKRLIYRANYRGFKEADMILGGYAKAHVHEMNETDIAMFEDLLGAKDHDIYGWINGTLPVPANYDTELLSKLRGFNPKVV